MEQMGYDKGLIRYTTENAVSNQPTRILRPRMVVYAGVLIALTIALVYAVASRTPLALDVIRDRNALYRQTDEGLVENVYTLKLINMDDRAHRYGVTVKGIDGIELEMDSPDVLVDGGEVLSVSARVRADPHSLKRTSTTIAFVLEAVNGAGHRVEEEARFLGPVATQ
jgi:polyferredoxin